MKKQVIIAAVLLGAAASFASVTPALGPWNEGDSGTTHQYWDFTPGFITAISGDGYQAIPEEVTNPDPLQVVASISPGGTWDQQTRFRSNIYLSVNLEIPNYGIFNPYKEIWVDLGTNVPVVLANVSLAVTPTDVDFESIVIPGQGAADFGIKIWPNPYVEKIGVVLLPDSSGFVDLDYIHVDTLCVPEPATALLLGFGVLALLKHK